MPPFFRFDGTTVSTPILLIYDMGPGVAVRDFVFHDTVANQAARADASSVTTGEAFGIVTAINTPGLGQCQVLVDGEVGGFAGLVPGGRFLLGISPGSIVLSTDIGNVDYPDNAGNVVMSVGYARSATVLFANPGAFTIF